MDMDFDIFIRFPWAQQAQPEGGQMAKAVPHHTEVSGVHSGAPRMHQPDRSQRPDDRRVHFRVFPGKSILCYINGHHKQYILVDTIFNHIFLVGLPGNVFRQVRKYIPFGAGARKVFVEDSNKDMSWKPKMKHVVKCCVY